MAYTVMAFVFMAFIVMACIVMACIVMACKSKGLPGQVATSHVLPVGVQPAPSELYFWRLSGHADGERMSRKNAKNRVGGAVTGGYITRPSCGSSARTFWNAT